MLKLVIVTSPSKPLVELLRSRITTYSVIIDCFIGDALINDAERANMAVNRLALEYVDVGDVGCPCRLDYLGAVVAKLNIPLVILRVIIEYAATKISNRHQIAFRQGPVDSSDMHGFSRFIHNLVSRVVVDVKKKSAIEARQLADIINSYLEILPPHIVLAHVVAAASNAADDLLKPFALGIRYVMHV